MSGLFYFSIGERNYQIRNNIPHKFYLLIFLVFQTAYITGLSGPYPCITAAWYTFSMVDMLNISVMSYFIILAAIGIALFLSLVFSSSFTRRNASGGIISFFLLVFMAAWASQLWVRPMGPVTQGIAWIPLVFVSSLVAFLLAFSASAVSTTESTDSTPNPGTRPGNFLSAIGFIFWIIVVLFLAVIVLGYYFSPRATEMAFTFPVIHQLT